jgi:hypothetical protein
MEIRAIPGIQTSVTSMAAMKYIASIVGPQARGQPTILDIQISVMSFDADRER